MKSEVSLDVTETEGATIVAAGGEIDISNVESFRAAIERAEELGQGSVRVDLCGVSFLDTAGIGELIRAAKRLKREEKTLQVVVRESSQPEYVLRITGLGVILDICHPHQAR